MTSPRTSQRNRHACARTIVTLQQQDGGYALLWEHYDNNNMAATLYCCCCRCILHLQQYSRRLNLFFFLTTMLDVGGGSTLWPGRFTPGKETQYPFYRGPSGPPSLVWTGAEYLAFTGIRSPKLLALSQSLKTKFMPIKKRKRRCYNLFNEGDSASA